VYDKRQLVPLMVVVWLGSLFKETTFCCILLILFGEHWSIKKRLAGFALTTIAWLITRKLLMAMYGVKTMFFALNNVETIHDMVFRTWSQLVDNVHLLFSTDLNPVLFTNAGALFIMMLIPWRTRRDVVFKTLALVFIIGQFLCGHIEEFRIWYELLPLGWMLISEAISNRYQMVQNGQVGPGLLQPGSVADDRTSRVMKGSYWLMMGLLLVIATGVLVMAELIPPKPEESKKSNQTASQIDIDSNYANNLAWMLATSSEATNRNGVLAVELAEHACERTHYRETIMIGTLAAAYAEAGRFDDAISTGQKACTLASELGEPELLKRNQELLALYRAHLPYHEVANSNNSR
jgi:hypothetical protein